MLDHLNETDMFSMDMKIAGFDEELNDAMKNEIKDRKSMLSSLLQKIMQAQEF